MEFNIENMTEDTEAVFGKLDVDALNKQVDKEFIAACETSAMRGRLTTCAAVELFVRAGKATLTIASVKTGTRYTFKFSRPKEQAGRARPIWVKLLTGSDNESSYTFLGTLWDSPNGLNYRHSSKPGTPTSGAPGVQAMLWLIKCLNTGGDAKLGQAEVWHEGRCGRCGRKLTVPSSIESGFGPECIQHV